MKLNTACTDLLEQLLSLIDQLTESEFSKPCKTLSGATLGQHIRHTVEFFICLQTGAETGIVNYDNRKHDRLMETEKQAAKSNITNIASFISRLNVNRPLTLAVAYENDSLNPVTVETNLFRELIYNIEHVVHHMAIMRIAVQEIAPQIVLPETFGVAASTTRYRASLTATYQ